MLHLYGVQVQLDVFNRGEVSVLEVSMLAVTNATCLRDDGLRQGSMRDTASVYKGTTTVAVASTVLCAHLATPVFKVP